MAVSCQGGNVTAQQWHGRSWSVEEALSLSLFVNFGTTTRCPLFSNSDPVDLTPLPELVHRQSPGADNVLVRCTLEESSIHPSALGEKAGIFSLSACSSFSHRSKSLYSSSPFSWPQASLHLQVVGQLTSKSDQNHISASPSPQHRHLHLLTSAHQPRASHRNPPNSDTTHPSPSAHQPPSCSSKSACASLPAKAA